MRQLGLRDCSGPGLKEFRGSLPYGIEPASSEGNLKDAKERIDNGRPEAQRLASVCVCVCVCVCVLMSASWATLGEFLNLSELRVLTDVMEAAAGPGPVPGTARPVVRQGLRGADVILSTDVPQWQGVRVTIMSVVLLAISVRPGNRTPMKANE